MSLVDLALVLFSAALAAGAGLAFVALGRPKALAMSAHDHDGVHFLFNNDVLEHATPAAAALVGRQIDHTDWDALYRTLSDRFPDLPCADTVHTVKSQSFLAADEADTAVMHLTRDGDMLRVVIQDVRADDAKVAQSLKNLRREAETLQFAADTAPYPVWSVALDGTVLWANAAHDTAIERRGVDASSANTPLFPLDVLVRASEKPVRARMQCPDTRADRWYNVTAERRSDRIMCHAVDIDAVIQAEVAQRNFVQTLAKTFAQLSIGLAIFDRNGQLALFNPALVDLTNLPAEFLSGRPDLLSFFDRLRDNRVMPEPKNYVSWRQEIADVIAAATHSSYQETWTLDAGQTYRVSGRPHPDGAVAFLIEDITAEVSLTRNFRAELELGQSMVDTFEDAIAVFSPAGFLTFCNSAYRTMWKLDPDNSFADISIIDTLKHWQADCEPNPAWGDIRDFVLKIGDRAPWDAMVLHKSLGAYQLRVSPIVSGATVLRFTASMNAETPTERHSA